MTKIYEANNHILIHTGYADPAEHRHMAAHIILSMKGEIRVESDGAAYLCKGVMIPSGTAHKVDTSENDVLVFMYDCTTGIAKQIQEIQCIPNETCARIAQEYAAFEESCTASAYGRFENSLLAQLGFADSMPAVRDERILSAMQYIRSASADKLSCREVADAVCLSQGRFSHLFKEQVGMTFAAYLIYQRIMRVYSEILHGKSITEAALEAGFSSSAHFADVNRRVFGISAGAITRDLRFTKIQ